MSTAIYAMTNLDTPISDEDALQIASILSSHILTHHDLAELRRHLEAEPTDSDIYDFDLWQQWHRTLMDHPGWSVLADMMWAENNIWRLAHNHHAAIACCLQPDPDAEYTTDKLTIYAVLNAIFGNIAYQLLPYIGYIYWG